MFDLTNRFAVVTGASGSIGAAIMRCLSDQGADVVGCDYNSADLIRSLDVTDAVSWRSLAAFIAEQTEKVDILVNCAGLAPMGRIEDFDAAQWRSAMAVNVEGVALGLQAFLPLLKAGGYTRPGGASVVNIASAASRRPSAMSAAYCASKAAVAMLTKVAAVEFAALGYGIRVNSVHPGVVEGPMMDQILKSYSETTGAAPSDLKTAILDRYLVKRFADPAEVATSVLYLASDEAAYINGTEQHVDGGYLTT